MSERLKALADAGVSIWLDDLSRERIDHRQPRRPDRRLRRSSASPPTRRSSPRPWPRATPTTRRSSELAARGARVDDAIMALTTDDVRDACDILRRCYDATDGVDGRVSIEVDPGWPCDTDATIAQAARPVEDRRPAERVDQDPGDQAGPAGDHRVIAEGISVNVTLIFSLERYRAVIDAYLTGWSRPRPTATTWQDPLGRLVLRLPGRHRDRQAARRDRLRRGHRAEGQGGDRQRPARVRGCTRRCSPATAGQRPGGAGRQPAAAAVGLDRRQGPGATRHPVRRRLVVADTVNTMPEKTMQAFADHGEVARRHVTGTAAEAQQVIDDLDRARHRLRRRRRAARGRGRGEVRGVLERAARRRRRTRARRGAGRADTRPGPTHVSASEVAGRPNPLRDPQDRRLPRIAGPCGLVIFGVTGDLSHQEADAGGLRPGQPRPAAAGLRAGRVRPARLGAPGLRPGRARRGQGSTPAPRSARRSGSSCPRASGSSRASSTTTTPFDKPARDDRRPRRGARHRRQPRVLPLHPAGAVPDGRRAARARTGWPSSSRGRWSRVVIEKPFGHDLASARELNRDRLQRLPAARRSSGSTTTWARRRSRTCWRCGSPTSCSSRSGTTTTSTTSRSPWPRTSASAAAPATTTASAPPATSSRTTCCSCSR